MTKEKNTSKDLTTFRTPKRTVRTPLNMRTKKAAHKAKTPSKTPKQDLTQIIQKEEHISPFTKPSELKTILTSLENKENELVKAYRKENEYLREAKKDTLLFKKLIGLEVTENEGVYECYQEIMGRESTKSIRFTLSPDDSSYVYRLLESANVELPSFLCEEISFDESQLHMFFFKVMEALVSKSG